MEHATVGFIQWTKRLSDASRGFYLLEVKRYIRIGEKNILRGSSVGKEQGEPAICLKDIAIPQWHCSNFNEQKKKIFIFSLKIWYYYKNDNWISKAAPLRL